MLDCTIPSAELTTKGIYSISRFIHSYYKVGKLAIRSNSYNNTNNDKHYNKFLRNRKITLICFVSQSVQNRWCNCEIRPITIHK